MTLAQVDTATLRAFYAHLEFMAGQCEERRYFRLSQLFHDQAEPVASELQRREVRAKVQPR